MKRKLTAVSLFSGCGGFDWGVQECGVDIIWANDNDTAAASAYKALFPSVEFVSSDVRKVVTFPSADILIGCYPCTGFSEGAKRRWKTLEDRDLAKNDTNFLFLEYLRAIDAVKPKAIFIENVRGMLSAGNGSFLQLQLDGFASKGYKNIKPMLLDSSEHGVAQTRKRVFLVGFHESIASEISYEKPIPTHGKKANIKSVSLNDVIGDLEEWPEGEFYNGSFHGHYLTRNRKRNWLDSSFTIVANGHHVPLHPMGEPMIKLGKDHWALQGELNRRLSWRECARIQGLPDHISIEGSLLDKYKVIGNSVPPLVAQAVVSPAIKTLTPFL